MAKWIGVLTAEHIAIGLVEDHRVVGEVRVFPKDEHEADELLGMPSDELIRYLADHIAAVAQGEQIAGVGLGFPGIVREGRLEESPNLRQMKGTDLQTHLGNALAERLGRSVPVSVLNDADAIAAGIAATFGHLDRVIRVWTLGNGIGYGRYPWQEGVWEGGHTVVSLDPKEVYCGCGGAGHLESIMGHRAMRLRFLDLEPDEVFAEAKAGDARCREFVKLWHRALAAATASSVHTTGPGRFFVTGRNARYVDLSLLQEYLHDMVKMSPLQGASFQVVPTGDEVGIIGAAVTAEQFTAATAKTA